MTKLDAFALVVLRTLQRQHWTTVEQTARSGDLPRRLTAGKLTVLVREGLAERMPDQPPKYRVSKKGIEYRERMLGPKQR